MANALIDILEKKSDKSIKLLFNLVKDFQGANNRYGQLAVTDFLDYLVSNAANLLDSIKCAIGTTLQCNSCKWVCYYCSGCLFKLHIPPGHRKSLDLQELLDYNSGFSSRTEAVWCEHCRSKTGQHATYESHSDIILFELIRVHEAKEYSRRHWLKYTIPINFSTRNISLFGTRKYHVTATCHHKGSLAQGHWYTKVCLSDERWYELNDLKPRHTKSSRPGIKDSTVVVLLCVAADRLMGF